MTARRGGRVVPLVVPEPDATSGRCATRSRRSTPTSRWSSVPSWRRSSASTSARSTRCSTCTSAARSTGSARSRPGCRTTASRSRSCSPIRAAARPRSTARAGHRSASPSRAPPRARRRRRASPARCPSPQVVTCDLGGTSLDVALIAGGEALRRTRGALLGHWTSLSMVDVDSVGSGGGSIAWVDAVGAIRVGPAVGGRRARARVLRPGGHRRHAHRRARSCSATSTPIASSAAACRWTPPVPPRRARRSAPGRARPGRDRLGHPRGRAGADGARRAQPDREPRPRAADAVAPRVRRLRWPVRVRHRAVRSAPAARRVPHLAPVLSAFGAATAPLHRERVQSVALRLPAGPDALEPTLADAARRACSPTSRPTARSPMRARSGSRPTCASSARERSSASRSPCDGDGRPLVDGLHDEFRAEYVRRFGAGAVAMGVAIEVMTLRAIGSAPEGTGTNAPGLPARRRRDHRSGVHASRRGPRRCGPLTRGAARSRSRPWTATARPSACLIDGPALVDAGDTTVWIAPGHVAALDERGSLVDPTT